MKPTNRIRFGLFLASLLLAMLSSPESSAQRFKGLGKKLGDAVERGVTKRIEEETEETTDEVLDEVFEEKPSTKSSKKSKSKKSSKSSKSGSSNSKSSPMTEQSARDFEPGQTVIYSDQFAQDAIGDFPVTWNTNTGAEVVTLGDNTRWLKLSEKGSVSPMKLKDIPNNSTIEFELAATDPYSFYTNGLHIYIVESKTEDDVLGWSRFRHGQNGVDIWLHPQNAGLDKNEGQTEYLIFKNGKKAVNNKKTQNLFTINNNRVKVGLWRQDQRLRVYIDGQKVWDLPRAFDPAYDFNRLAFYNENKDGNMMYIANLRVAKAGADKRHALLEKGTYTTSDILFGTGSDRIERSSYPTIDEIGQVMQENPNKELTIIGHTDSEGDADANQKLSLDRALSVKMYLVKNFDIKNSRIHTQGMGEEEPVASNKSEAGKKQNRRVEFRLK